MEQTPSVILKLMGLDKVKVPPQDHVSDKQKVLSEKYLQKVASIGVRKKRSSHQHHHSSEMSTDEKEESEDSLKVLKTMRRDKYHNPSKVKSESRQLMEASHVCVNRKPETLVDTTSSLNLETSVNSGRIAEQRGNMQLQQKANNGLREDVLGHGQAGLYEKSLLSKSQLDLKDRFFISSLKYVSIPCSCNNPYFSDGLLQDDIFGPRSMRIYPERRDRKNISYHKHFGKPSSRSLSKVSEEVYVQMGNAANGVLDTVSSSFFPRGNEVLARSSDILKPASTISVNEMQHSSLVFCFDGSYVGSEAMNKTQEQMDATAKLQAVGRHGQGTSARHQLPTISAHRYGTRNMNNQGCFSNDKAKMNFRCKVGVKYGFARKVPMTRPLCTASIADNRRTMAKDNFFHKYWGLRKNASASRSTQKSRNQDFSQKDCSEDRSLRSGSDKSLSFTSHLDRNHIEESCIGLHKLKKRCYGNDLSDNKPVLTQLPRSEYSPSFIGSQILHETCLMVEDGRNYKYEDSHMSEQNAVSPNSSVDANFEVVGWSHNNPTKQQSESTASSTLPSGDIDSLSHTSTHLGTSEFQEDSVYSLCSGTEPDSLGSFEESYRPSPISVLDHSFKENTLSKFECLKDLDAGEYDSSEGDDEGFGLNVSSDEDCGDESAGEFEEKKGLVGLFKAEESRDFSYVVEVLTEAGTVNRSLFTDFSTWHSEECPISPSVFENLEKKFGGQQLWKRPDRRLLFDRINLGLLEILQPCSYIPTWEKPVSRRLNAELSQDMIEEEIWGLFVAQEKKANKNSADKMLGGEISWVELGDGIEDIVREIVELLIEEFANEIVSLENF